MVQFTPLAEGVFYKAQQKERQGFAYCQAMIAYTRTESGTLIPFLKGLSSPLSPFKPRRAPF